MITISLCMIVKNEEKILSRCLDSICDLCDEIIIVDTGSTDKTKEIAKKYTDKIFDFTWNGNFSDARNYAFSKSTMDYIYSADADEVIDEKNQERFLQLKEILLPEIEIVQMKYVEQGIRTVLNSQKEYRPKLYKRQRSFTWIDPVHETIRTLPVVFDSDIEIMHLPEDVHAKRDFTLIEAAYRREGVLSQNLIDMYIRELYKWADVVDLKSSSDVLDDILTSITDENVLMKIFCVKAKEARLNKDIHSLLKYSSKILAVGGCSEICCELGDYFYNQKDYDEAYIWFYNALNETESILDSDKSEEYPNNLLKKLNIMLKRG